MARSRFGGTSSDFVYNAILVDVTRKVPELAASTLTFWTAKTGGTQYTDILDEALAATGGIVNATSDGHIPLIYGPDGILEMYVDAGGSRWRIVNTDAANLAAGVTAAAASASSASSSAAAAAASAASASAPTDAQVGTLVNNPTSATRVALNSKFGSKNSHRLTDSPYLAAADGVTSDHVALNNAGADAAASGLPVVLPYTAAGYLFSAATNLVSGVTYILEGGVRVKRGGAANANFWNASATTGVTIRGGTFDGNGLVTSTIVAPGARTSIIEATFQDTGTAQPASSFGVGTGTTATTSDVYVKDCRFINMRNNIHVQGSASRWTIADCDITGYGATAIAVDGDATHRSTDVLIKGNRCHDHNSTTRAVTTKQIASNVATITVGTAHTWVVGDTVYIDIGDTSYDGNKTLTAVTSTTLSFAKTAANSGPTASPGTVTWGNRQPISVQGDDSEGAYHERITITGNQVLGNYAGHGATSGAGTSDTISVHHAKNVVVTDNITEGSGDCGITISYRSTGVTVTGNTVVGAANAGVAVGASSTSAYVKGLNIGGNTLRNCGQNGVVNWASAGINVRRLYGGIVENNYIIDDQMAAVGTGAVTFTDAGDLVTTPANHGLSVGQVVSVADVVTTTGITANKPYYVLTTPSTTTLTLSAEPGGSTLALTTNGTGTGLMVAAPTCAYGITVGDTTGTSQDVHIGPNHYWGVSTAKRLTPAGNLRLTFTDVVGAPAVRATDLPLTLNSTAMQDVTGLVFPLEANAVYDVEFVVAYTTNLVGGATPGIRVGFATLAGASVVLMADSPGAANSAASPTGSNVSNRGFFTTPFTSAIVAGGFTGATPARIIGKARVTTGTTAGNLQLQAAQQTADAVNTTTVVTGSYLKPPVRIA